MKTITIHPVGRVFSRKDSTDDDREGVVSEIRIDREQFTAEAVLNWNSSPFGICSMDREPRGKNSTGALRLPNRMDWPKAGFAQSV